MSRSRRSLRYSGTENFPAPPSIVEVSEVAVVPRRGKRVLLVQRPSTGRWANLWEFPHGELEKGETHDQAAIRLLNGLTGYTAKLGPELMRIRHGVTQHRITMLCFEAFHERGTFRSEFYVEGRWLGVQQLEAFPVSAPQRRVIEMISRPAGSPCC